MHPIVFEELTFYSVKWYNLLQRICTDLDSERPFLTFLVILKGLKIILLYCMK